MPVYFLTVIRKCQSSNLTENQEKQVKGEVKDEKRKAETQVKKCDFESPRRGMLQARAHMADVRTAGFVVHHPVDLLGI